MATDNSSPPIASSEVTIQTATVDVKVLRLSGKQMTLSVFRQLPERSLTLGIYDHDARPHPYIPDYRHPWGIVRYFWDKFNRYKHCQACWANRVQVIFEEGGNLFRDLLFPCAVFAQDAYYGRLAGGSETLFLGTDEARFALGSIYDENLKNGCSSTEAYARCGCYIEAYERWFREEILTLDQLFIAV